jgi:hypothetical protein
MATQKHYSADEAQRRFEKLPLEIQDLLYSYEMILAIKEVGHKNGLHIDQVGLLQAETSAVMLGFTEVEDFSSMLVERLHLDQVKADHIAKEINDSLFLKIRESMKKLYPSQPSAPTSVTPPSVAPATSTPPNPIKISTPPVAPPPVVKPPPPPPPAFTAPPAPAPAPKPIEPHPADVMLTQKTVTVAPPAAPKPPIPPASPTPAAATQPAAPGATPDKTTPPPPPKSYGSDPYREPIEP